ncbi:MAG: DUF2683 family protein [Candidatus Pacearchaeota archaeon]|nr:DUF2683 family protein [Candidatus Pacearchaeota archaeon]
MEDLTVSARVELGDYANKVLGIIKIKYGLKDKSEALNKFIEIYGNDVLEREATEEYAKKIIAISNNHFKKYGSKKISLHDLNKLCEA